MMAWALALIGCAICGVAWMIFREQEEKLETTLGDNHALTLENNRLRSLLQSAGIDPADKGRG